MTALSESQKEVIRILRLNNGASPFLEICALSDSLDMEELISVVNEMCTSQIVRLHEYRGFFHSVRGLFDTILGRETCVDYDNARHVIVVLRSKFWRD